MTSSTSKEIEPVTMPGIHKRFLPYLLNLVGPAQGRRALDIGAGHGAMSQKLDRAGFRVEACELYPEIFEYDLVTCCGADATYGLPFEDESFDIVVAVEVAEHMLDHVTFYDECARVLKPGGRLLVSTPNVLSLKSRLRFFLTGFFYSFTPLDSARAPALQHVRSLTVDQHRYTACQAGFEFEIAKMKYDRAQNSSLVLIWLLPLLWLGCRYLRLPMTTHNRWATLVGRVLFMSFRLRSAKCDVRCNGT